MFSSTGKWKSFLVVYMIVCYLMDLTSTWANVIISFVLCLSLTINSLPKSFVEWFNTHGILVGTQIIILGPSKLWAKCVFLLMIQCVRCPHVMRVPSSAVAGVTNHYVSTTFFSITTFTDFLCEEFFELYWHWKWNEELWVLYGLISYKQKCCR